MPDEKLDEIKTLIEDIKGLLLLMNQDKLDEVKKRLLKPGTVESQVYDLCDGTTTQDIATKIQRTPEYVNAVVSTLRKSDC